MFSIAYDGLFSQLVINFPHLMFEVSKSLYIFETLNMHTVSYDNPIFFQFHTLYCYVQRFRFGKKISFF